MKKLGSCKQDVVMSWLISIKKFFNERNLLNSVAESNDPFQEFADNVWTSRNAFLRALEELEAGEDKIEDLLKVNGETEFGR